MRGWSGQVKPPVAVLWTTVPKMRVAAIDLGAVRVGLAVSDELGMLAHPRDYLPGKDKRALLVALKSLAQEEEIEQFLVGLPRLLDGKEGRGARNARSFGAALEKSTGVPVLMCDEWWTTREAHGRFRQTGVSQKDSRSRIDGAAAALLLQSWLDSRSERGSP